MTPLRLVATLLLATAGCSEKGEKSLGFQDGPSQIVTAIGLDDSTAMGFSANDVLEHFGAERQYQVRLFDDGSPIDVGDQLYSSGYAPFTVAVDATTATAEYGQSVLGDGTVVGEGLRLTLTVTTTSTGGELDVTGKVFLHATALSDDQITWVVDDTAAGKVLLQTGTLPSWVAAQTDAVVGQSRCAGRASEESLALYHTGVLLTDSVAEPMLRLGMYWDNTEQADCAGFEAIDMVWLVPEA